MDAGRHELRCDDHVVSSSKDQRTYFNATGSVMDLKEVEQIIGSQGG